MSRQHCHSLTDTNQKLGRSFPVMITTIDAVTVIARMARIEEQLSPMIMTAGGVARKDWKEASWYILLITVRF
jgi:hypothetical protein